MQRKRLNVNRRAGRLIFRRETSRLNDGTPWGETLWIFSRQQKPRRVVSLAFRPILSDRPEIWWHDGWNYTPKRGLAVRRAIRAYLTEGDGMPL